MLDGVVCLSKIHYLCFSSGILKKEEKAYGKTKKTISVGQIPTSCSEGCRKDKAYPVELEYTWNRQVIRKTTNVFVKVADWNQNGNQGRGEIRACYGGEFKRLNQLLLARVERIDSQLAEYNEKHPNQITADVVSGFLADKPLARRDQGKDFVEFTLERLSSDYSRNRIGRSRYENGKSCMNIFQTFLRATKQGSYRPDAIYVGDMTPELLDSYINWRREIKQNSDATINHKKSNCTRDTALIAGSSEIKSVSFIQFAPSSAPVPSAAMRGISITFPDGVNLSLQEGNAEGLADLLAIYRSRCRMAGGI